MTFIRSDEGSKFLLATNIGFNFMGLGLMVAAQSTLVGKWLAMSFFFWIAISVYALSMGYIAARPVGFTVPGLAGYWIILVFNALVAWFFLRSYLGAA